MRAKNNEGVQGEGGGEYGHLWPRLIQNAVIRKRELLRGEPESIKLMIANGTSRAFVFKIASVLA